MIVHLLAFVYICLQATFNITYIFDSVANHKKLFFIGIFKYCLVRNNSIQFSLENISDFDMVAYRALFFGIDLFIFSINTFLYFLNRDKKETEIPLEEEIPSKYFFENYKIYKIIRYYTSNKGRDTRKKFFFRKRINHV